MKLDTFFDNFGLLADAPNGVQKLREMILKLAVQGKLVPQDPKDEPASVLLEKIKAEKEQLTKKTKNKKFKPLPHVQSHEILYELPKSWVWVRIGDLLEFGYGKGLPKETKNELGNVPVYGANGIKRYYKDAYTKEPSIIVGRKGSAGAVNKVYKPCWPLDVTFFIQPSKFLDFEFIFELLKSLSLEKLAKGIKPGLNRNEVYNLPIGLPPFNEQKSIVAKVDELMALCDELEARKQRVSKNSIRLNDASIHKLLTVSEPEKFRKHWQRITDNFDLLYGKLENVVKLRQAILQLSVQGNLVPQDPKDEPASVLLEKIKTKKERLIKEGTIRKTKTAAINPDEIPYELPVNWKWVKLGEFFDVRDGTHDTPKYVSKGFPLITSKNISNGMLDFSNIKYISAEDHKKIKQRSGVDRFDILFAMIGSIGNPVIVDTSEEFSIKNVALFKYYSIDLSCPDYLLLFLKNASEEMKQKSSGAVQSFVSLKFLRNYLFPMPPLKEQKRIANKVDQLMALCDELENGLSKSQANCDRLIEAAVAEILAA